MRLTFFRFGLIEATVALAIIALALFLVMSAQAQNGLPPPGTIPVTHELVIIGLAFLTGATRSLIGYLKTPGQDFRLSKLIITGAVGGVVGLITIVRGVTFEDADSYLAQYGLIVILQEIALALYRRYYTPKPALG